MNDKDLRLIARYVNDHPVAFKIKSLANKLKLSMEKNRIIHLSDKLNCNVIQI